MAIANAAQVLLGQPQTIQDIMNSLNNGDITVDEAMKLLLNFWTSAGSSNPTQAANDMLDAFAGATTPKITGTEGNLPTGTTTPTTTEPISGAIQPTTSIGALPEELFGLQPAFQRGIREAGLPGGIGGGPFGAFLESRFSPTRATFLGNVATGNFNPENPQTAFADFARSTGGVGIGGQAQNAFMGLLNLARGSDISNQPLEAQRFINPQEFSDFLLGGNLAREAIRGRIGGAAASQLIPGAPALANQFLAGPQAAQTGQFLPFLQKMFGF